MEVTIFFYFLKTISAYSNLLLPNGAMKSLGIFSSNSTLEKTLSRSKGKFFEETLNAKNRAVLHKAQEKYKNYLHFVLFWQQEARYDWFENCDRNKSFFHSIIKGREKKLQLYIIQGSNGNWLEEESEIAAEAMSFYEN